MPHVDKRTGELVIRIVYDGLPEAGKTTNVQALCRTVSLQRRGKLESPGTTGRRTEFFDWLDFSGGFIDGKRVRCQLVSVPGQPRLLHRRRYLLESADAVVFVTDSRPEFLPESERNLSTTRRILEARGAAVPVGVLVQANKQDLAGALSREEVASALQLSRGMPVVSSVASKGEGVMQTFILAARLATDRVRGLLCGDDLASVPPQHESAETLHRAIQELVEERQPASELGEVSSVARTPPSSRRPTRSNRPPEGIGALLTPDLEVAAGHVWPPVKGRGMLASVNLDSPEAPARVSSWAPPGCFELRVEGWVLHSSERWQFDDERSARLALLRLVKGQLTRLELTPECRVIFLGPDGAGWRIWVLTEDIPVLGKAFAEALTGRDAKRAQQTWADAGRLVERLGERESMVDGLVAGGADGVGWTGERPALLGLDESGGAPEFRTETSNPRDDLLALAERLSVEDPTLRAWLAEIGVCNTGATSE